MYYLTWTTTPRISYYNVPVICVRIPSLRWRFPILRIENLKTFLNGYVIGLARFGIFHRDFVENYIVLSEVICITCVAILL